MPSAVMTTDLGHNQEGRRGYKSDGAQAPPPARHNDPLTGQLQRLHDAVLVSVPVRDQFLHEVGRYLTTEKRSNISHYSVQTHG